MRYALRPNVMEGVATHMPFYWAATSFEGRRVIGYLHDLDKEPYIEGGAIPDVINLEEAEIILASDLQQSYTQLKVSLGLARVTNIDESALHAMVLLNFVDGWESFKENIDFIIAMGNRDYKKAEEVLGNPPVISELIHDLLRSAQNGD